MKLLIALLLAGAIATGLEKQIPTVLSQLDKASKTDFARELSGLIELNMMQSSAINEVLKEIKAIKDQMGQDQAVDDSEYASKLGYLNVEIEVLEYQVAKLGNQLKLTNQFLGEVSADISTLIGTQSSIEKQLNTLNSKEEDVRTGYAQQIEDVKKRSINNSKSIDVLNEIITKLTNAVFSSDKTALSEIHSKNFVEQLRKELGDSNPIVALVSVTTKFDVAKVTRVIQLLENIRDNLGKQLEDDANASTASQLAYEQTLKEVEDVRDRLAFDLGRVKSVLKRRNEEKVSYDIFQVLAEKNKKQLDKDLPLAQELLSSTRIQRENVIANYNQRTSRRNNEINVIGQAYSIVAQQVK